jgi:hypothetical protein
VTEQFKDLVRRLTDIRLNGKRGTCKIEFKVREEVTGTEPKPVTAVVEPSTKET